MSFYNGLVTEKLAESKEFYVGKLGFSVKYESEWFVLLERDGREMAFMQPDLEFQNKIFRAAYGGQGLWITIEVEDVSAEYARFKDAGVSIAVELCEEEWGETHFSILDPNGVGIDFVKYHFAQE